MEQTTQPTAEQKKPLTSHEMAVQAADEKAARISAARGNVKIIPLIFYREGDTETQADPVIGFLQDPPRLTKLRLMDEAQKRGEMEVAADLLNIALIKEESDYRLSSENQEFDDVFIGACLAASIGIVRFALNQHKKK
jgi:hypothetical protein